jgi:hypothetical protein
MTPEQQVRITYDAFNARDEPTALAGLVTDVQWDRGRFAIHCCFPTTGFLR